MAFKNRQIIQYDEEGNEVAWHLSQGQAAKSVGITKAAMSFYMLGKSKSPICAGFVWKYAPPADADEIQAVVAEEKKILPINPHSDDYKWESWRERIARRAKKDKQ